MGLVMTNQVVEKAMHILVYDQGLEPEIFSEGAKKNNYCSHTFIVQSMLSLGVCPHRKFFRYLSKRLNLVTNYCV